MRISGKTRQELEVLLKNKSRAELLDLIHSLTIVEQLLKPSEIASRSALNKRAVLKEIREGRLGPYYCRARRATLRASAYLSGRGSSTWEPGAKSATLPALTTPMHSHRNARSKALL